MDFQSLKQCLPIVHLLLLTHLLLFDTTSVEYLMNKLMLGPSYII